MASHENGRKKPSFWLSATRDQARDTGMALALICLIVFLATQQKRYVTFGVLVLLADMICPAIYKPAAKIWFGLSHLVVHTSGTHNSMVVLPGLPADLAAAMRETIRRHIQTDFA